MKHIKMYKLFESSSQILDLKEITLELTDYYYEIEIRSIEGVFYRVLKEEIEKLQNRNLDWFNQDKIENISEIILVGLTRDRKFYYNDIKEYIERCVEYMANCGFNYLLEPVGQHDVGLKYSIENIQEISDKKLMSFHIRFYR